MENKQPLSEVIKETIDKIKSIADTKTVIGDPITLVDGITIIPVSKVSVGAGIGGGEYGTKKNKKKENKNNHHWLKWNSEKQIHSCEIFNGVSTLSCDPDNLQ